MTRSAHGYRVASSLHADDPAKASVDGVLSFWAELAAAEPVEERGRSTYELGCGQVWPSDSVLGFLVRLLSFPEILEAMNETSLVPGFDAGPRDLGGFYHRCYDRIRAREPHAANAEDEA